MSGVNSDVYQGKATVEKSLVLVFDEGDNILDGIRQAIRQHNLTEASVVSADGELTDAMIHYYIHNRFTQHELKNGRIVNCSGRFMNLKDGIYGELHVGFMLGMQLWNGTLARAKAKNGLQLVLRFKQPAGATIPSQ